MSCLKTPETTMKSILKLSNPLWKTPERRKILDAAVQQSAAELEGEIKQKILTGPKSGKLYRRGAITRAASKKNLALGLRRAKGNPKRVVAGANFHRASARGESPSSDSGGLLSSVRARSTGEGKAVVATSKKYAEILDDPNKLDRPFFESTAEEFKPKFKGNISAVIKENS